MAENLISWQFIASREAVAILMAAVGALVAVAFKRINHLWLCNLISFAAGALLAVVLFDILPETVEMVGRYPAAISFVSGYLLFFLITKFIFHICPACSATHTEVNFKALTLSMMVALSVHSFMDGLAIYGGYHAVSNIGLAVFLAVAYHKVPEGMALTLVARGSGMGRLNAIFFCILLEGSTMIAGTVAGYLTMTPESGVWIGWVLGHVGGGFLFLVIHALFSEVVKHHPRSTIISAIVGGTSIGLISVFAGVH